MFDVLYVKVSDLPYGSNGYKDVVSLHHTHSLHHSNKTQTFHGDTPTNSIGSSFHPALPFRLSFNKMHLSMWQFWIPYGKLPHTYGT